MPNNRTELVSCKITPANLSRLMAAMRWMSIPSRQEALNQALALWLATVEASNPDRELPEET